MSNRYIKDSIWTSVNFNKLSFEAEAYFYRILLATDDWGCLEIAPLVIKGKCYPLKKSVSESDISKWNQELVTNNLIRIWEDNNRQYAQFVKFADHNVGITKHDPRTPCPPWVLTKDRIDPRASEKTIEAYHRIAEACKRLSNNGHRPSLSEVCTEAKSSKSTVSSFFHQNKHLISGTGGTDGGTDD
jgi:hypothetical protein